jgi:uncharacterized protein YbaA (DUF1428 family)
MTKRIFYVLLIFMAACTEPATTSNPSESSDQTLSDTRQTAKTEVKEDKTVDDKKTSSSSNEKSVVGKWTYYESSLKMKITLNLNADGTFKQSMGDELVINGTWKKIDDNTLEVKSEMQKERSKWILKEHTSDKLSICWNPDSPTPKTIPFERAK